MQTHQELHGSATTYVHKWQQRNFTNKFGVEILSHNPNPKYAQAALLHK